MEQSKRPDRWFTPDEEPGVLDFWRVYDVHYAEVTSAMQHVLAANPKLGEAVPSISQKRERTRELVREGLHGDWAPYGKYLQSVAVEYARVGLTFEGWSRVVQSLADVIAPHIVDAHLLDPPRLKAALRGMRHFIAAVQVQLATKFIQEKEAAREESAARKAAMLGAAIDGIIVIDDAGSIVEFNPAAERLFGHTREEALGQKVSTLLIPHHRHGAHREELRLTVVEKDESLLGRRLERTLRRADGTEVPTEVIITRIVRDGPPMFTAFVRDLTFEKQTREALADSEQRLRALAARLQSAIEEERTRIAREIHDELGQQLTAFKLDLAWVKRRYELGDRSGLDERLTAMAQLVDETAETVRRLATRLRPGILDDLGLVPALEWQAREFESRTGMCVDITLPDDGDLEVSPEHATAFFRIEQELLTNVMRHAQAKSVRIRLEQEDDQLVLEVHDDGRGITTEEATSGKSLGLVGMRERVGLLHGRIDIQGSPGNGTTVTTRIPLAPVDPAP